MTALIHAVNVRVPARAYAGLWVVDCLCNCAVPLRVDTPLVECPECGRVVEVVWPSAEMVAGVERLLMLRPNRWNRNWSPGETLVDLLVENVQHGVMDHVELGGARTPLVVTEARVSTDLLPAVTHSPRRAVGV